VKERIGSRDERADLDETPEAGLETDKIR